MVKVLIIEDDTEIRSAYVYAMGRHGFKVAEAGTVEDGLRSLDKEAADVVVLDMLMPGLSGMELLRQMDIRKKFPKTKFIAFSNIDSPNVVDEAKTLGVSDYLLKVEVTPVQMIEKINQLTSMG